MDGVVSFLAGFVFFETGFAGFLPVVAFNLGTVLLTSEPGGNSLSLKPFLNNSSRLQPSFKSSFRVSVVCSGVRFTACRRALTSAIMLSGRAPDLIW